MNRRDFLMTSTAAAIAAAMPAPPAIALPKPLAPAWIVGTPGEYDWQFVRAATADDARLEWVRDILCVDSCEEEGSDPAECDCEFCYNLRGADATRMKRWDESPMEPTPGDWIEAGMGHTCNRCGEETHPDCGGRNVNGEAVCEDCLELADWDIIDPEIAAEMRAEDRS